MFLDLQKKLPVLMICKFQVFLLLSIFARLTLALPPLLALSRERQ